MISNTMENSESDNKSTQTLNIQQYFCQSLHSDRGGEFTAFKSDSNRKDFNDKFNTRLDI